MPLSLLTWWWWWWHRWRARRAQKPRAAAEGDVLVCVSLQPWTVHRAMVRHSSQYVWYRRLYVIVSCYVWVNELVLTSARACPREKRS